MARAIGIAGGLAALLPAPAAAQTPTLSFSRATVPGGYDVTVLIALKVDAPAAGVRLSLTSGAPTVARFAATGTGSHSITIPGGQRTASVFLRTLPVVADARVAIAVASASSSARAILTVQPLRPASVTVPENAAYSGLATGGLATVQLSERAPKEGLRLQLVSTSEVIPAVPFTIEAGDLSIQVPFAMPEVRQVTPMLIGVAHASLAVADARRIVQGSAAPVAAGLHLYPLPVIASLTASTPIALPDSTVRMRVAFASTVRILGAPLPRDGLQVFVESTHSSFRGRLAIYHHGQTEAVTSHVIGNASDVPSPVEIRATATGGSTSTATIQIVRPSVRVMRMEPERRTIAAGDSVPFTVTLAQPAPRGGITLATASSSPSVAIRRARASVAAGALSGRFMVAVGSLSSPLTLRISTPQVTAGGVISSLNGEVSIVPTSPEVVSGEINVVPVPLPQISGVFASQPSVVGGQPTTMRVTFTPATLPADLTSLPSHTLTLSTTTLLAAVAQSVQVNARTTSIEVPIVTTAQVNDTRVTFAAALNGVVVGGAAASGTLTVTAPLPRVTAIRAARTTLVPGDSVPVTVTIDRAASGAGLSFPLTSTAPLALAVPSSVNIPAGASSITFFARAQPTVTAATSASITTPTTPPPAVTGPVVDGTSNTVQVNEPVSTGPLSIVPLRVAEVSLSPNPVFGGFGEVELTVRLSAPATSARTVALRVTHGGLTTGDLCTLPASLTVPAGSNEARHRFSTGRAGSEAVTCTVFAELTEVPFTFGSRNGIVRLHPVPTIVEIVPTPREIVGGTTLSGQARFVAGTVLSVTSGTAATIPLTITSNSGAVRGTSVMVPAGAASVSYSLSTSAVAVPTPVQLTYTLAGANTTREFMLTPPAPRLATWTLDRSNVIGGDTVTATLTLDRPAVSVPEVIIFNTSAPSIFRPADVTIPVGATRATVRIATGRVNQVQQGSVRALQRFPFVVGNAEDGADQFRAILTSNLTVEPLEVRQLLVDQPVGFGSVQRPNVTLILNAPAPSGGAKVVLTRSAPVIATVSGAALPLVLTVPGGADRITVALRTQQVQQLTDFTLSAFPAPEGSTDGPFTGVFDAASPLVRTIPMQLLPIPILANLRVEPTTVVAGTTAVILGDLTNSVRPTLSTATPPTLSLVVNSDRPDVVASGTVIVRPGDTTVRLERPTTAITADATVRFTVTLAITRFSATLLVRAP